MILDIRSTHGGGKSYIPHYILKTYPHTKITDDSGVLLGYHVPEFDLAIVGKYTTNCGGCDEVGSADEVVRRVRLFHSQYINVLLEGILVAHTFQRYADLARELGNYKFFFLDTPLDLCIERVKARRLAKGNTKILNPANITKDWNNIWNKVREKVAAAGLDYQIVNHMKSTEQIIEVLKQSTPISS